MTKSKTTRSAKVDAVLGKAKRWKDELGQLREIALGCELREDLKWGQPCYTLEDDSNVVLIHGFKEYFALLFFKGALMQDPDGLLVQQTANVQSARQMRFTSGAEVGQHKAAIKRYINEAIAIEKAGLRVERRKTAEFAMPEEFQKALDEDERLADAFRALTPGRQRGYLLHFSSAKQAKTREARVEKARPRILEGKGLDD